MADSFFDKYAITGVATLAGMHQLVEFTRAVGKARGKHKVEPPETDGPPEFVRTFRAHQNSVEFFPISLAGLWVASGFFHPVPASVAYFGWLYGRQKYFKGYIEDADKRLPGFYLSIKFLQPILIMCALGVGHKLVRHYANVDLWELISNNIPALSR